MRDDYSVLIGGAELLDRVGPLWAEHRDHHAEMAPQWAGTFVKTFEERRAGLLGKAGGGLLVVLGNLRGEDIGYCVCTITADGLGEIDSFHVVSAHRRHGIGGALITRAMEWFEKKSAASIAVDVLAGNEMALRFYSRFNFSPRTIRMLWVKDEGA